MPTDKPELSRINLADGYYFERTKFGRFADDSLKGWHINFEGVMQAGPFRAFAAAINAPQAPSELPCDKEVARQIAEANFLLDDDIAIVAITGILARYRTACVANISGAITDALGMDEQVAQNIFHQAVKGGPCKLDLEQASIIVARHREAHNAKGNEVIADALAALQEFPVDMMMGHDDKDIAKAIIKWLPKRVVALASVRAYLEGLRHG
ncbi:hypothetical protein [Mesorhizobium sp. M8A.F.Ca.ET.165.01.1.1]|uniref:hypothetical protein n=1 Tax=Mesorhizobium sp. M8A.F.Ca.ET.165.01.1.1 TaxID=2563960 RepID=UPI0010940A82|nr:hypothetical protein [Mesorhizobium sp. M8A.F.Ca.ET.165.01.1.1]TGT42756.1 hypothetical protein EN808_12805 [Mesorhizobium sp. M8A.F.Ca.ET.165.01.1.1]